jgi:hypothetical protein
MYWLTFESSRGIEVYIVEARHLMMARMRAGMAGQQGQFQEGHKLDAKTAKRVTAKMIGRTRSMPATDINCGIICTPISASPFCNQESNPYWIFGVGKTVFDIRPSALEPSH